MLLRVWYTLMMYYIPELVRICRLRCGSMEEQADKQSCRGGEL